MAGSKTRVLLPLKQSMRDAMEHLLARYREIRPLFLAPARPMKVEWNIKPYFGVFPRVFKALRLDREERRGGEGEEGGGKDYFHKPKQGNGYPD